MFVTDDVINIDIVADVAVLVENVVDGETATATECERHHSQTTAVGDNDSNCLQRAPVEDTCSSGAGEDVSMHLCDDDDDDNVDGGDICEFTGEEAESSDTVMMAAAACDEDTAADVSSTASTVVTSSSARIQVATLAVMQSTSCDDVVFRNENDLINEIESPRLATFTESRRGDDSVVFTPIEQTKVSLDEIMRNIDLLGAKIDTELKCAAAGAGGAAQLRHVDVR